MVGASRGCERERAESSLIARSWHADFAHYDWRTGGLPARGDGPARYMTGDRFADCRSSGRATQEARTLASDE